MGPPNCTIENHKTRIVAIKTRLLVVHAHLVQGLFRIEAHFTEVVKAKVQPKSSIPINAKVEISPKGFTIRVKAEIEKIFSICPK
jgi:hypothetical protein